METDAVNRLRRGFVIYGLCCHGQILWEIAGLYPPASHMRGAGIPGEQERHGLQEGARFMSSPSAASLLTAAGYRVIG